MSFKFSTADVLIRVNVPEIVVVGWYFHLSKCPWNFRLQSHGYFNLGRNLRNHIDNKDKKKLYTAVEKTPLNRSGAFWDGHFVITFSTYTYVRAHSAEYKVIFC